MRMLRSAAAITLVMATGCATTVRYSPDLVAGQIQRIGAPMPGKVLVHTTAEQDAYVYSGRPKSWAGSAVKAKIPFGELTREIALKTFEGSFSGGAVAGRSARDTSGYSAILMPYVTHFDYLYRPSPGSLVSMVADVRIKLRAKVMGPGAVVLIDKEYDSNRVVSKPTAGYLPKVLGAVAQTVLCDLMGEVARDMKLAVLQQAMAAPAARPTAPVYTPPPAYTPAPVYNPPPEDLPDPVQVIPDPVMVE